MSRQHYRMRPRLPPPLSDRRGSVLLPNDQPWLHAEHERLPPLQSQVHPRTRMPRTPSIVNRLIRITSQ